MTTSHAMHALRFYLRNAADVSALLESGDQGKHWDKLDRVVQLAEEQAGSLLHQLLACACSELSAPGWRVGKPNRPATAARHWDAWVKLKRPRVKEAFAFLGVNLGYRSALGGGVHVYLGHVSSRFVHGPALAERLRQKGSTVHVADGREGRDWGRGTIIIGHQEFTEATTSDDLEEFVRGIIAKRIAPFRDTVLG